MTNHRLDWCISLGRNSKTQKEIVWEKKAKPQAWKDCLAYCPLPFLVAWNGQYVWYLLVSAAAWRRAKVNLRGCSSQYWKSRIHRSGVWQGVVKKHPASELASHNRSRTQHTQWWTTDSRLAPYLCYSDVLLSISEAVVASLWRYIISSWLVRCCSCFCRIHRNWCYRCLTSWHRTYWCSDNDRVAPGSNSGVLIPWDSSRHLLSISSFQGPINNMFKWSAYVVR